MITHFFKQKQMEERMSGYFGETNKEFWGFSLMKDGQLGNKVKKYSPLLVHKIIEQAFEQNWELHWVPSIPCVFVKMSKEIWHYLPSQREAENFQRNLVFSKHYPCCELY